MLTVAGPNRSEPAIANDGDDAWFRRWRSVELARLEATGTTYLDYTGAALYPESLVRRDSARLIDVVLGNQIGRAHV